MRKILYIIGNGFDLNLGLKTRYKDFYERYLKIDNPNEYIRKLKSSIGKDYVNWADLEIGFGEYTKQIKKLEEFDIIYKDIVENLSEFLENEQQRFNQKITKENSFKFYSDLISPFKYLSNTEQDKIKIMIKEKFVPQDQLQIDFMIFNYTHTVEALLKYFGEFNDKVIIGDIYHIHGEIGKNIIIGVDDLEQIGNDEFQEIIEVKEQIVKSEHNKGLAHGIDNECKKKIEEADCVCIFGSSIGLTDQTWWDHIGDLLRRDMLDVIVFTTGDSYPEIVGIRNNRIKRAIQSKFSNRLDLYDNFFVGINTDMFNLPCDDIEIRTPPEL